MEEIIETTRASAVLVGNDGFGPWQNKEMRGCLSEFVTRNLPVIPVLLPGAPEKPALPIFLKGLTWVDLRGGLTEEALDRLEWGISGKKPNWGQTASDQVEPRSGPHVESQRPTHIVDPWGRGNFLTISAAIQGAKPGDRILVRPGLYQERLVIDKTLEIIGDGPAGEIRVQAKGRNVLCFRSAAGRVARLTLLYLGGGLFWKRWHAVDIEKGQPEIEECDITMDTPFTCVAIHGGADPLLRRNRIYGSVNGVSIFDQARGTLENNEIFSHGQYGVEMSGASFPTLVNNKIYGVPTGVKISASSRPTLLHNEISADAYAAISIEEGGSGKFVGNRLRGRYPTASWIESTSIRSPDIEE